MIRLIVQFGAAAGALLIVAMMLLVFAEVAARGAFGFSFLVANEYSGYIVVALTFLGIPYALDKDALLRVEVIYGRLKAVPRLVVTLVFDVIALICSLIIGFYLARLVLASFERGTFSSTPAMTPIFIPQAVMPLGMALVAIILLARVVRGSSELAGHVRNREREPR